MKKSLFIIFAFLLTTACSDSESGGGGAAPAAMVGLWADENTFNTLNKANISCNDFQALKNMNDKGQTVIELGVVRVDKNGAVFESAGLTQALPNLIYVRSGTVNAAGSLALTGEGQKALDQELKGIKEAGAQVQVINKLSTEDDGNKLVLSTSGKITFQGQSFDIPETKTTAVKITQEQLDAVVVVAKTCF